MTTNFSCGAEEPLQSNEQLYAIDEQTGAVELAAFDAAELCRYSFLPNGESSANLEFAQILTSVAVELNATASWVLAFLGAAAGSTMRSRALETRLARERWETVHSGDFNLAVKSLPLESSTEIKPPDSDPLVSGWMILLGSVPRRELFTQAPFVRSLRQLAVTHRLQPSRDFLIGCGQHGLSIAYSAKSSRDATGLVVVCPRQIQRVIRAMQEDGLVGTVLYGADASDVWRLADKRSP